MGWLGLEACDCISSNKFLTEIEVQRCVRTRSSRQGLRVLPQRGRLRAKSCLIALGHKTVKDQAMGVYQVVPTEPLVWSPAPICRSCGSVCIYQYTHGGSGSEGSDLYLKDLFFLGPNAFLIGLYSAVFSPPVNLHFLLLH